ncbi:MAG: aminodeoxychorismate synthase component I [Spirochaetes bacterium]|nr:aminodeoxychorismate synthase component I [Spirochaetota bacterium]
MIDEFNSLGRKKRPFLFIIDFDCAMPIVQPLDEIDANVVLYDVRGVNNVSNELCKMRFEKEIELTKFPIPFEKYKKAFDYVTACQRAGDSYLCNLTFPTPIETNLSLKEIFAISRAPYRLLLNDKFVVFSPEQFIHIQNGIISTYPMKGTIRADIPNAERIILSDEKEFAEHLTIVDLLRNDLSIVANHVRVEKFRYVQRIETSHGALLQVSSKISGILPGNYHEIIGDIVRALLPAGSVTGAPKRRTVEIIKAAEGYDRGYYTGIFGYFDGNVLDSAVMIRFIEKTPRGLVYKSGGGITVYSDVGKEYRELIDKVYIPIG